MTVAGGLNLFWVLSVLVALGVLASAERHRRGRLRDRCRRGFAVFLAAVALFPCVSASDDLVRFGLMVPTSQTVQTELKGAATDTSSEAHTVHLARLLQILDSFQLSAAGWLLVTLFFCSLFICMTRLSPECCAVAASIRGPPPRLSLQ